MALIPQDILEDVRLQTDIVNLIGEYVRLEKRGRNYIGVCPFHQEKDPSFSVSPEKQIFYCFGCQSGGNAMKFLMLAENLTFLESVRRLADRAGIYLPDVENARDDKRAAREERAWKANELAREFYHRALLESSEAVEAREYLLGRGLSGEIIKTFKIGFASSAWHTLGSYLMGSKYSPEELLDFGLVGGDRNRLHDRFRNRIMFPVTNPQGRVVAFGGRVFGNGQDVKSQPKYLNTAETPFFNKSKILFGLDLARKPIRESGFAVIMEGYMDVVTAHQFGICNTLASMGTSLTADQGKLLMRYTRDIYIAYDADNAGQKAAARGLDILQEIGCRLRVIGMPQGTDPDDFIRQQGLEGWQKAIEASESLLEYKLRLAQKSNEEQQDILGEVLPNLVAIQSEIELEEGIKLVASRLNTSWESIKGEIRRFRAEHRKNWVKPDKIAKNKHNIILSSNSHKDAVMGAEVGILRALIADPQRLDYFRSVLGDEFILNPPYRDLYQMIVDRMNQGDYEPGKMLNELEGTSATLLSRLLVESTDINAAEETQGTDRSGLLEGSDTDKAVTDYISVIKKNQQAKKRMRLMQELAEAEKNNDLELVKGILKKLQVL